MYYRELAKATFAYPAIDNHAHPLLTEKHRNALAFEGLISEASGDALADSIHTLASYRSTAQLAKLFGLKSDDANWDEVKKKRANLDYEELCRMYMKPSGIQCILIDDGLAGVADLAESYEWHDQFTSSPTKRIVRIETVAEVRASLVSVAYSASIILQNILLDMFSSYDVKPDTSKVGVMPTFEAQFVESISGSAHDPEIVGFKSVICYRCAPFVCYVASCHSSEQDRT